MTVMNTINSANPLLSSPLSASPQPTNTGTAAPRRDNGFAQLLSQRQAQAAHEAQAAAAPKAPADKAPAKPESEAPRPAQNQANAAARNTAKPVARERATAAKADKPTAQATQAADRTDAKSTDVKDISDETQTMDPALADWMATLNRPVDTAVATGLPGADLAGPAEGQGKPGESTEEEAGAGGDLAAALGGGSARGGKAAGGVDTLDKLHTARDAGKAEAGADSQSAAAWQAAVEQTTQPEVASVKREFPLGEVTGPAASATAPARTAEASAPTQAAVSTPVTSPEFSRELGVQISVLARDGVQQAELHLNPGDMGPISVQIELNGAHAHVNFGADSADTRQIIENGLPELASAMRDAGFTLSGGGVHQQASGRGEQSGGGQGDDRGRTRGVSGGAADAALAPAAAPQAVRSRVATGGVDTYA